MTSKPFKVNPNITQKLNYAEAFQTAADRLTRCEFALEAFRREHLRLRERSLAEGDRDRKQWINAKVYAYDAVLLALTQALRG